MGSERLQKILAAAGVASRRAAEKIITDGRVKVNGEVVRELGAKADTATDRIEVAGFGVIKREPLVTIALYKPPGVVTTVSDPEGRPTVLGILHQSRAVGRRRHEGHLPRVYPVGRLDFDAEGLLLLTNDGELSQVLMHPKHHVPKTYVVKVKGKPAPKQLERLRRGVRLKEKSGRLSARPTLPAEVQVRKHSRLNTWLELTIVEGRHHQVKRMCQAIGHPVIRLIRTELGGIPVEPLQPGQWRFLTMPELGRLRGWSAATPPPGGRAKRTRRPDPAKSQRRKARSSKRRNEV
jgi:pseudouridine synthase